MYLCSIYPAVGTHQALQGAGQKVCKFYKEVYSPPPTQVWRCLLRRGNEQDQYRNKSWVIMLYSLPCTLGSIWSSSRLLARKSAALPFIRLRETLWNRCLVASWSSCPVRLAIATPSCLTWSTAALWRPPRPGPRIFQPRQPWLGAHSCLRGHIWLVTIRTSFSNQADIAIMCFWLKCAPFKQWIWIKCAPWNMEDKYKCFIFGHGWH